jgi:predicted CopG family antitoxin
METKRVTLTLPINVYEELLEVKKEESHSVADFVRMVVSEKLTRMRWQRNLEDLRREIREAGGLELRGSKEEVIERLRETRREIFETEYAHLYR